MVRGFALGGVYLARHDGRARFIGRNGNFSPVRLSDRSQEADIIGKLHAVPRQGIESAMGENDVIPAG
jgi:hypothetical protein